MSRETGDIPALATARQALCLFAFVEGVPPKDQFELDGDDELLRIDYRDGAIAALATLVSLDDYCGAAAEANLANLDWLAPRTVRHAEVLRRAMRASAVFPMPFGTLFSHLESLTAFMAANEAVIARFLAEVSGHEEWGLKAKARLDDHVTLEAIASASWPDWSALTPGVRYLRLRRDRLSLIDLARERAAAIVADLVAELALPSAEVRTLAPRGGADESGAEPIASYALLVPTSEAENLNERARTLAATAAAQGVELLLSGPWPPFSFRPSLG